LRGDRLKRSVTDHQLMKGSRGLGPHIRGRKFDGREGNTMTGPQLCARSNDENKGGLAEAEDEDWVARPRGPADLFKTGELVEGVAVVVEP